MSSGEQLSAIFLAELEERVRALGRDLLILEREASGPERTGVINSLFRTAHSLKGAAAAMKVEPIEVVCHRLEEVFAASRDGRLDLDPTLFRLLFASADAIEQAGKLMAHGDALDESGMSRIVEQLDAAISRARTASLEPPVSTAVPVTKRDSVSSLDEPIARIAAQKLDALLTRSGELLTLPWRADSRIEELSALRTSLRHLQAEWRAVERQWAYEGRTERGARPLRVRDRRARRAAAAIAAHTEALRRAVAACDRAAAGLVEDRRALEQATAPLDAEIHRARMLPFASACEGLERIVRDLSKAESKEVELRISGGELELDRTVIQRLRDPLIHLVRNAIDHGIETGERRRALGKSAIGHITIGADVVGTRVELVVADDGCGIDRAAVRERSAALGLPNADDKDVIAHIFLPGFSTRHGVTRVSGRGIGLDAVKTATQNMRGSITVTTEAGRGTRFTLSLPVSLSNLRVLLIQVGDDVFGIESSHVIRLLLAPRDKFASVEGRPMLLLDEGPVPAANITEFLGMGSMDQDPRRLLPVALLQAGHRRLAAIVDELVGEREVVIRSLGPRLEQLSCVNGSTLLPTGKVALILNVEDLVEIALADTRMAAAQARETTPPRAKKRVLLVDDSMTTRALERSILEVAGYEVATAADGDEAWRLLLGGGADIVVSDVDMPRMDGFVLTEAIRGSERFADLPVVLVTARESESDKARGMAVGADSYLVKSAFDQKALLDALAQLL